MAPQIRTAARKTNSIGAHAWSTNEGLRYKKAFAFNDLHNRPGKGALKAAGLEQRKEQGEVRQ